MIYSVPEGFQLVVERPTAQAWAFAKAALSFCHLVRDGDDEGAFILDRLPDHREAATIRKALSITKRKHVSPDHVRIMREALQRGQEAA